MITESKIGKNYKQITIDSIIENITIIRHRAKWYDNQTKWLIERDIAIKISLNYNWSLQIQIRL